MTLPALKVLNILVLGAVLVVNGLAGSGALSGESIGAIANRYPSYFLPANYVFGIWSLIYLWLAAFAVHQALPGPVPDRIVQRVGLWWLTTSLLNIAWVTTFSFAWFGAAMLVMLALLAALAVLVRRVNPDGGAVSGREQLFAAAPFGLYYSWISVAVVANLFQYGAYRGWSAWGFGSPGWSAMMLVLTAVAGVVMAARWGIWVFPLVVAWATWGIADRFADVALIATTAHLTILAGLLGLAGAFAWRYSRRLRPLSGGAAG